MIFFFISIYFDYYPYTYIYLKPIVSRNEVFIPTQTGGILVFNLLDKSYINLNKYSGLSSNFINMITFTEDEETLIVLTDKKIDFFLRDGSFVRSLSLFLPVFPDTVANCIYSNGGNLYIGFNNGISFFSIDSYPYGTSTVRYFFKVKDIMKYKDIFYFATDSAIYSTTNFRDTSKIYPGNFYRFKIINDTLYAFGASGLLNLTTMTKLISNYNVTDVFIKYEKFNKKFFVSTSLNILEYINGVWLWKITNGYYNGVFYYKDSLFGINRIYGLGLIKDFSINYFRPPLPAYVPACDFIEKDNSIYVVFGANIGGSFMAGLRLISRFSNDEWVTYNWNNSLNLPPRVSNIEIDSKNRVWIGIWSGETYKTIYHWNGDTSKPVLITPPESTNAVTGMCFGPGDTIWIGGHLNYIFKGYIGADTFEWNVYKVQNIVWTKNIVYDKNGTVYFGTASHNYENGVFYKEGENFLKINYNFGDIIYSMARDRNGDVWVGTEKGLFKIVNKEVVKEYNYENSNLYPGAVASIAFSKDNTPFILQNGYGVLYLNKYNIWERIQEFQGLITEEASKSMFVDSKNYLWIGTYQGLFRINLNQFNENKSYDIIVYPNPIKYDINKKLTIKGENIKGGNLMIFNSNGSCILEKSLISDSVVINISEIDKPGNYIYIVEKNNIKSSGRFFIIR